MNSNALVIVSFDGIASMYSGVGVMVNFFFEAFKELGLRDFDLFAVSTLVREDSKDFNRSVFESVRNSCVAAGGDLMFINTLVDGSDLRQIWNGNSKIDPLTQWESCSYNLAVFLADFAETKKYKKVYAITHDTLFAKASCYITHPDIHLCWIPHSLAFLFKDNFFEERVRFEREGIKGINQRNDKIGFISEQTRSLLNENYELGNVLPISFYTGIYENSAKYKFDLDKNDLFRSYNIPLNKKIIFSWGRCVEQKGFDLVISSYNNLLNCPSINTDDYHLVLLAPTFMTSNEYYDQIQEGLVSSRGRHTFINEFHSSLAYYILKDSATSIVILASRYESFGITSIEVSAFCDPKVKIIYSALPSFNEVFLGRQYAFPVKKLTSEGFSEVLNEVATISDCLADDSIDKISENKFDFVKNYAHGIGEFLCD